MKLTDPVIGGGPRIQPGYVAFDSFGTKSMCLQVKTPELTLTIDPGASAASNTFPLPYPKRQSLLHQYAEACRQSCAASRAVVVSHYHLDHFLSRRDPEVYADKAVFCKLLDDLPPKQKSRAETFHKSIDGLPEETVWADGRRFRFGRTELSFTTPVWHGRHSAEPGTVIMTEVRRGRERLVHTSDVSGPTTRETTDIICASKAQTVVLDGYPTSHLGSFATDYDLVISIINVCRILAVKELRTLVIDHHMCRDYRYPAFFKLAYARAKALSKIFGTAAEIQGRTSAVLQGYQDFGPTKWSKWVPLELDSARQVLEKAVEQKQADRSWLKEFDRWVG